MAYIYVPELNQVFASINAAARAAGVDPSNVGKILRGKRKTAGGYHFAYAESVADQQSTRKQIQAVQQQQQQQRYQRGARRALLDIVHDRLVSINRRYFDALKEGSYNDDPVLQQMMSHTDFYGVSKRGGYDTTLQNLRQYSEDELINLMHILQDEQLQYTTSTPRNAASLAFQMGLSTEQYKKYEQFTPILFELYKKMKEFDELNYKELVTTTYTAMQANVSVDMSENFILQALGAIKGNRESDLKQLIAQYTQIANANSPEAKRKKFWEKLKNEPY